VKERASPTFHVVPAAGVWIVAVGGLLPAAIVTGELVLACPALSVTRRRALNVPGCEYVKLGFAAVESP
jgi:hypothetical protein